MSSLLLQFRAWWHSDINERLLVIERRLAVPRLSITTTSIHCPICSKAYDISDIPSRVDHATIVCNNPGCGEHMDLFRNTDTSWRVEFRDKERA
jgi:transposase-like protein